MSTAMVGSPNAMLSTTLAVLRPTPGSASSASRSAGTLPPCSSTSFCDSATTFFALVRKQPDGLDEVAHARFAERDHLLRRVGEREQRRRRLVDAGIGRLRRQHHRDQQREGIDVLELALGLRVGACEAAERLLDFGLGPLRRRAGVGLRAAAPAPSPALDPAALPLPARLSSRLRGWTLSPFSPVFSRHHFPILSAMTADNDDPQRRTHDLFGRADAAPLAGTDTDF